MKEDEDMFGNPSVRRKARRRQESIVIKRNIQQNNYPEMVEKFEKDFDKHMRDLLNQLTKTKRYETHIANLSQRLDYNEYYSKRLHSDF